ncbi:unnamed protein product [Moneuplotes crassus]|uniref:Uncharacterized protein n=1 Tax=Euplotes crassus TaxID=5936 RepID=A0AAD1Y3D5_EUPCR|nr:unnamed protein product [Moneuplotes crassus]
MNTSTPGPLIDQLRKSTQRQKMCQLYYMVKKKEYDQSNNKENCIPFSYEITRSPSKKILSSKVVQEEQPLSLDRHKDSKIHIKQVQKSDYFTCNKNENNKPQKKPTNSRSKIKTSKKNKSDALKKGINYNDCVDALNKIQRSIKTKKVKKRRGTDNFQKLHKDIERGRSRSQKRKNIKKECADLIKTLTFDQRIVWTDPKEESSAVPINAYNSTNAANHERNKVVLPHLFGIKADRSVQQFSSTFHFQESKINSKFMRNSNSSKLSYSNMYETLKEKTRRSLSPKEPTPKFNKKFKKYLHKRKKRTNKFDSGMNLTQESNQSKQRMQSKPSARDSSIQDRKYRPRIMSSQEVRIPSRKNQKTLFQLKRDKHKKKLLNSSKELDKEVQSVDREQIPRKRNIKDFIGFFRKSLEWQQKRNKKVETLKKNYEKEAIKECTFQPITGRRPRSHDKPIKSKTSQLIKNCASLKNENVNKDIHEDLKNNCYQNVPKIKQKIKSIQNNKRRLYSPTHGKDDYSSQFLRVEDFKEINILPGAAEILGEVVEVKVDKNSCCNLSQKENKNVSGLKAVNLLESFNNTKEEIQENNQPDPLEPSTINIPLETKRLSKAEEDVSKLKPPIPHPPMKIKSTSPLSKITEKDETLFAQTESLDFTAQMEGIDEASCDPSYSIHQKSYAEKTQFLNATASFEFEDFNSKDFKEHSVIEERSALLKSKGKIEDYCSTISCASVTSESAHAQILFPTNAQRVTLVQMRNKENEDGREILAKDDQTLYSYDEEVVVTEKMTYESLPSYLLDQFEE